MKVDNLEELSREELVELVRELQNSDHCLRLAQAEEEAARLLLETREECRKVLEETKRQSAYYWEILEKRLQDTLAAYPGLLGTLRDEGTPEEADFGPDD